MDEHERKKAAKEAERKLKADDLDGALADLEEIERQATTPQEQAGIIIVQAHFLNHDGHFDRAIHRLVDVDPKRIHPDQRQSYIDLFCLLIEAKGNYVADLAGASRILKRSLLTKIKKTEQDLVNSEMLIMQGILFAECDRYEEAVRVLEPVPISARIGPETRIALGECALRIERFDEAKRWYGEITASNSANKPVFYPLALTNIARCFMAEKNYEQAIKLLTDALILMPEETPLVVDTRETLAICYDYLGKPDEAKRYQQKNRGNSDADQPTEFSRESRRIEEANKVAERMVETRNFRGALEEYRRAEKDVIRPDSVAILKILQASCQMSMNNVGGTITCLANVKPEFVSPPMRRIYFRLYRDSMELRGMYSKEFTKAANLIERNKNHLDKEDERFVLECMWEMQRLLESQNVPGFEDSKYVFFE